MSSTFCAMIKSAKALQPCRAIREVTFRSEGAAAGASASGEVRIWLIWITAMSYGNSSTDLTYEAIGLSASLSTGKKPTFPPFMSVILTYPEVPAASPVAWKREEVVVEPLVIWWSFLALK